MIIYVGADHRGFEMKEQLVNDLKNAGYTVIDVGATSQVPGDDYDDYARAVAEKVSAAPNEARGILICGSGFGMDITANKFDGVRSGLPMSPDHAYQGRHDDDINVLSIAADFTDLPTMQKIVKIFLSTPFAKDARYERRLEKMPKIEEKK